MPTPLYDQLLTQAGGRTSGSPVARIGGGGRTMQPSIPSYPSPPSSTAGATGRPSSRPVVPVGVQAPTAPAAPVSSPAGPTPAGTPLNPRGPIGGGGPEGVREPPPQVPQPAQPPPPPQMRYGPAGGTPTAALGNTTPAQPTLNLNRVPSRRDYVGLLPGTAIGTPYGAASVGSDGHPVIQFSTPEHEARYRQDETQYRNRFGPTPLSAFPGAPQPIVQLGRPAWNPFTGAWTVPQQ
jgi:hypothetical protein